MVGDGYGGGYYEIGEFEKKISCQVNKGENEEEKQHNRKRKKRTLLLNLNIFL